MPTGSNKLDIDGDQVERMVLSGLNPDEAEFVLNRPLEPKELSAFNKLIAANKSEHTKKMVSRYRRAGILGKDHILSVGGTGRVKGAIRGHIADMILREMGTVEDLIGYTTEEFIINMASKFRDGMSWDNWGEWHIDHIKPRRKFTTKQIKECFNPDNIQPLWKYDNLKKGSKWEDPATTDQNSAKN